MVDKVEKVMHEYKHGELHSGSKHGPKVTSYNQAVAIAMSEAGKARKKHMGTVKHGYGAGASYEHGGPVEPEGGQVEAGEFVIPAHVTAYLGQKFFQDLVAKAEAEMGGGAPDMGMQVGALAEETPGSPA